MKLAAAAFCLILSGADSSVRDLVLAQIGASEAGLLHYFMQIAQWCVCFEVVTSEFRSTFGLASATRDRCSSLLMYGWFYIYT